MFPVNPKQLPNVALCINDWAGSQHPAVMRCHKNASSGIAQTLMNSDPRWGTWPYEKVKELHPGRDIVFMYRNPRERLESAYRFLTMGERGDYARKAHMPNPLGVPFEEWVLRICEAGEGVLDMDPHIRPQSCFCHRYERGEFFLVPTIELAWDWDQLAKLCGRGFPVKVNASPRADLEWTPEMLEAHGRVYWWDWVKWASLGGTE